MNFMHTPNAVVGRLAGHERCTGTAPKEERAHAEGMIVFEKCSTWLATEYRQTLEAVTDG